MFGKQVTNDDSLQVTLEAWQRVLLVSMGRGIVERDVRKPLCKGWE